MKQKEQGPSRPMEIWDNCVTNVKAAEIAKDGKKKKSLRDRSKAK